MRGRGAWGAVLIALAVSRAALAEEKGEPYDESAVSAALAEPVGPKSEKVGDPLEALPLPPRKKGFVLETHLGAMGFVGKLGSVSPTASRLHLQFGYEPFHWLMVFGEGDLAFTSTRYSPPSRGYAMYGFGAGVRLTLGLTERVSVYGQGDLGLMRASSDVLHTYGFYDAEILKSYFGGALGVEWYQVDPHYALALSGGVRATPGFARAFASDTALAWLGAAAIRYTF